MAKYIAFLRAINVGGHIVKMDHLRKLFESEGFSNVETFIASGNVIFDSKSANKKRLESQISAFLEKKLGYAVGVFVRNTQELAVIANFEPFPKERLDASHASYVGFLGRNLSDSERKNVLGLTSDVHMFHVHGSEVYWLSMVNMSESKVSMAMIEKKLGTPATFRNVTTVRKLASKYSA